MVDTRPFLGCCIPAVAPERCLGGGRCNCRVFYGWPSHTLSRVPGWFRVAPPERCPSGWLLAGLAGQSLDLCQRGRVGPVAGKIAAEGQGSRMARARHVQKYWYLFFCFHICHIVEIVG